VTVPKETEIDITRLHYGEHWPVGTIAAQLGLHPDVVKRVLGHKQTGSDPVRRSSIVHPFQEFIRQTLEQYPGLRATRLYDMLKPRGYHGSMRSLRDYVSTVRPEPKAKAYLRLETLAGEQAQIDWAHVGRVRIDGGERPLWVFVMVLSYSRALWAELVFDMSVESLCRSLTRASAYFGGVTRQWLFDNPKTVVIERYGDAVRFHPTLLGLCAHFRVQPRLCAVATPEHKGRVERAIRYLRDRFFAGRHIHSIEQGNQEMLTFLSEIAQLRPHPRQEGRTVGDMFGDERPRLLALPDPLPPTEYSRPVSADKTAFVQFDTNLYSVEPALANQPVTLVFDDRVIRVLDGDREVARHVRSYGRKQVIEDPSHRTALLEQRRLGRDRRGRDRLRAVCPAIDKLIARCVSDGRLLGLSVVRLTKYLEHYGDEIFTAAVAEVLSSDTQDLGMIQVACEKHRRYLNRPVPITVAIPSHIPDREVIPHNLDNYDEP
jgi:transposase